MMGFGSSKKCKTDRSGVSMRPREPCSHNPLLAGVEVKSASNGEIIHYAQGNETRLNGLFMKSSGSSGWRLSSAYVFLREFLGSGHSVLLVRAGGFLTPHQSAGSSSHRERVRVNKGKREREKKVDREEKRQRESGVIVPCDWSQHLSPTRVWKICF